MDGPGNLQAGGGGTATTDVAPQEGPRSPEGGLNPLDWLLADEEGQRLGDVRHDRTLEVLDMLTARLSVSGLAVLVRTGVPRPHLDAHHLAAADDHPYPPRDPTGDWNVFDAVELTIRRGELDTARRQAETAARTLAPVSPLLRFLSDAASAVVAGDDEYAERFDRLVEDPRSERWPFCLARVELAYGERLRLHRRALQARPHVERALLLFTYVGAQVWAEHARAVLRACGVPSSPDPGAATSRLTAQELRVAELAATGLTNRDIGTQLYLSPRTVATHLYRIFPKLGITSRAALRDALERLTGPAPTGS